MPKLEALSTGSGRRGGRRARAGRVSTSLAEINVVPLVDVMLVLLVIFMVAAPMMQQGFAVKLPQSRRSKAVSAPVTVTVPLTFKKDQRVQIDDQFVSLAALPERIRYTMESHDPKSVIFRGDGGVTLSELATVWDKLIEGGVENVSMQTQPATGRQP
ncbi:MAG: biopolymer transporter ExbD [Vicinamibacterales bacterium]